MDVNKMYIKQNEGIDTSWIIVLHMTGTILRHGALMSGKVDDTEVAMPSGEHYSPRED